MHQSAGLVRGAVNRLALKLPKLSTKGLINNLRPHRHKYAKDPISVFKTLVGLFKAYRVQIALSFITTVFLVVSVGEGKASNIQVNSYVDVASAGVDESFIGKPQTFSDQTILTGDKQQYTAINYTVEKGDSVQSIASRYGLHVGTILEANNIDAKTSDKIQPGQIILIPSSDTDTSLAWLGEINEEKARVAREAEIARQKAEKDRLAALARTNRVSRLTTTTSSRGTSSNLEVIGRIKFTSAYPYGWCTSYAAWKKGIPGAWGNAGSWYNSAKRAGWAVGSTPRAGAVMVSRESPVGHVAYVESVNGDSFTVSEMNYAGFGIVSRRTISSNSGFITGFIY